MCTHDNDFISTYKNLNLPFLCELQLLFCAGRLLKYQWEILIAQAYTYSMYAHTCTLIQTILSWTSLFTEANLPLLSSSELLCD